MDTQPIPTTPDPASLAAHIAAETADAPAPLPQGEPTPAPDAPEPEAEASSLKPDAELSEAARTLRRNRADERKAKIQRDIDTLTRERYEQQQALERLRAERQTLEARPQQPRSEDPEPVEADYADYGTFVADKARWAARQEFTARSRAVQESRQMQAREQVALEQATKLEAQHQSGREKYGDFDAVVEPVITSLQGNPRAAAVAAFLSQSSVGGELAYKLGREPETLQAVLSTRDPIALATTLARTEAALLALKTAPKPVTAAPAPPSQTVGGTVTAVAPVDTRRGVPLRDHIRIEEAELEERRRLGYRY
jgi:hypothetical protein